MKLLLVALLVLFAASHGYPVEKRIIGDLLRMLLQALNEPDASDGTHWDVIGAETGATKAVVQALINEEMKHSKGVEAVHGILQKLLAMADKKVEDSERIKKFRLTSNSSTAAPTNTNPLNGLFNLGGLKSGHSVLGGLLAGKSGQPVLNINNINSGKFNGLPALG